MRHPESGEFSGPARPAPGLYGVAALVYATAYVRPGHGPVCRVDDLGHLIKAETNEARALALLESGRLIYWTPTPWWNLRGRRFYGWSPALTERGTRWLNRWNRRFHTILFTPARSNGYRVGPVRCTHPGPHARDLYR